MILPLLSVKDIHASVKFYQEKLGFQHERLMPGAAGPDSYGFVNLGENMLGIGVSPEGHACAPGVELMFYLSKVEDLAPYYEKVQQNGVAIERELHDEFWGDRMFSVRDPDGHLLTFVVTVKPMTLDEAMANEPVPNPLP